MSPNDGGIALGQLLIRREREWGTDVSGKVPGRIVNIETIDGTVMSVVISAASTRRSAWNTSRTRLSVNTWWFTWVSRSNGSTSNPRRTLAEFEHLGLLEEELGGEREK